MVPQAGLEPALLSEQDFESSASTNSTTGARRHAYSGVIKTRNGKCNIVAYFAALAAFLRTATGLGFALRTLTADASMLFFKCRP